MKNSYFCFKQFTVQQQQCAMKVTTDACLFGAWCAEEIQNSKVKIRKVLDIGAGTGLLSLMVAQKNEVLIEAVEVEKACVLETLVNVQASPWAERIRVLEADIRRYNAEFGFDCIISNPPFYEKEIKSIQTKKNIAHHSEHLTLNQLLTVIQKLLTAEGVFFLLLPFKRYKEFGLLLKKHKLLLNKTVFVRSTPAHAPLRVMVMGAKSGPQAIEQKELVIQDVAHQYSEAFSSLLKDYYLYL
ncbi:MAG: methyltransferase [Flavisolibacter sp.]|nr:methyltransferase [Flavisolibacter sp.]